MDLKKTLRKLDEKFLGSNHIFSKQLLTTANKLNSSRSLMHSLQLDQVSNLLEPEIAHVTTNFERMVGKYSSAYYQSDDEYEVIDKIIKFPKFKESVYTLVLKGTKSNKYNIITKKPGAILTETYGYKFNNEKLDSIKVGDIIKKNEVLYKSTSFDEEMNYRLGINAKVIYITHPLTIEDALVITRDLARRLISIEYDIVNVSYNDNDILLNLYGDKNHYKVCPDIGEYLENATLCATRRINLNQALHDLKDMNMTEIMDDDRPYYIPFSEDKVVDITIYCNKKIEDIKETIYNKQILDYLKMQMEYFTKIRDVLSKIVNMPGNAYSDDLAYLYTRAKKICDPEFVWVDQNRKIIGNIIISFMVEKEVGVVIGSKFCGRFGDKGVVSDIVDREKMPYTYIAGEKVYADMICDVCGVGNRLNSGQLDEVELNYIRHFTINQMKAMKNLDKQYCRLKSFLEIVNDDYATKLFNCIDSLSLKDKEQVLDDIMYGNDFTIEQPPFYGNINIEIFHELYETFGCKPGAGYISKFGRECRMLFDVVIGDKYIYKLKHHPKGKFSARSTSFINSKDQPAKASSTKENRTIYPTTPLKNGPMETMNILIGNDPIALMRMNYSFSSSVKARRNLGQMFTNGGMNIELLEIPEDATNMNAEIVSVELEALGIEYILD